MIHSRAIAGFSYYISIDNQFKNTVVRNMLHTRTERSPNENQLMDHDVLYAYAPKKSLVHA
jgi:hypothetical protein